MRWLKWVFDLVFGCFHRHTTWPHRDAQGFAYLCCLDCGKELPYSVNRMSVVTHEELLAEQNVIAWRLPGGSQNRGLAAVQRAAILSFPKRAFPKRDAARSMAAPGSVASRLR